MSVLVMPHAEDQAAVEKALPGFMFALAFESLGADGFTVRADLEELANKASAAALSHTCGMHQQKLAGIVAKDGYDVMKNAGTNNVRILIGALAQVFVKLQDRGCTVDHDGLLVALSIVAEIDDDVTDWGTRNQINPVMVQLDNQLRAKGYFTKIAGDGLQLISA